MNLIESFLPEIEESYSELHTWLSSKLNSLEYRRKNVEGKIEKLLLERTLKSAAAQYYVLFPAHFFKVVHTLNNVVGTEVLSNWLTQSPRICLVDVGCGAGAASVAFISCILKLQKNALLTQPIEICCFGIDVNPSAAGLYSQMIGSVKSKIESEKLFLDCKIIPLGDSEARIQLKEMLDEKRQAWGQPFLSHVFIMQLNVVSPFSKRFEELRKSYDDLTALGVDSSLFGSYHEAFGFQEATTYKHLLEEVDIDHLHVVTIGTKGFEVRVQQMADAINRVFDTGKHKTLKIGQGKHTVNYQLPVGSYWKEQKRMIAYFSDFEVDFTAIINAKLEDGEWAAVINIDNLQLAWARARHHLLDESLADEVEIRLFESNLNDNLVKLRLQLIAYREEITRSGDRLHYSFPKGNNKVRPRGLSRIEEEILSTALIQKLGIRLANMTHTSFANKFSQDGESEYLYENWFNAYSRFIERACVAARNQNGGIVIRLDIKSFYTRIIRDQLKEIAVEQLAKSERVKWLIRLLLSKDIDEHEAGLGIVQGSLSSGFFANLYLLDLDSKFPNNNQWEVEFFRYVDDMIVVLPDSDPNLRMEITEVIKSELNKRGLELNDEKTEILTPQDFLSDCAKDEEIEYLKEQYDKLIPPLFVLNADIRKILKRQHINSNDQWWDSVSIYHDCLQALGLFFKETILSRRITSYLFNPKKRDKALNNGSELLFPGIPTEISVETKKWATSYASANQKWTEDIEQLRSDLRNLFHQSLRELEMATLSKSQERSLLRRIRYSANRLSDIGYGETVATKLVEILISNPWLFRDITEIVESLARQQFIDAIKSLLGFYSHANEETTEYMRAISVRAVRFLDQIDVDLWNEVAKSSVSTSIVCCLLATETWLSVGDRFRDFIRPNQLEEVETAFHTSTSTRLRKNYFLILAKFMAIPEDNLNLGDDPLLSQAFDIAVTDDVDSLFNYQEPEVIKNRYYSGMQDNNTDDGGLS